MSAAMFNKLYEVLKRDYITFKEAQTFIDFDKFRKDEEATMERMKKLQIERG